MKNNPRSFYSAQIEKYSAAKKRTSRRLLLVSLLRLVVFLAMVLLAILLYENTRLVIGIVLLGMAIFVFLVSRHSDIRKTHDKYGELITINKIELEVLARNFQHLPGGSEFEDPGHLYSQDIDIFGKGSFFQYLNRSALEEGKKELARLLLSNDIYGIKEKQEAIQELSEKADWRQNFSALATLVRTETQTTVIVDWLKNYQSFTPTMMKWLPLLFSGISVVAITAFFFDFIGGMQLILWFFLGLIITGVFLKKINRLSDSVSKVQDTFHQYYQLLELVEYTEFSSELMQEQKKYLAPHEEKVFQILKKFSRAIDSLDQRNNMLFGLFANGFLLWDLRQSFRLETWIDENKQHVEQWFGIISFLDAYNSLGNFAYNHPAYVFPTIADGPYVIKADQMAHPLLNSEKRVANDLTITREQFFVITGANMAGKSTFLRTVALQIVMANMGLPVCANSCSYSPIKLITSMRTTDSLTDDESYFFSELKRLKLIVDQVEQGEYFIILDEILKGTNSTDKAIGSRKFLQRLVDSQSTGIIATHDLSLCEVANDLQQVKNFYFDAEIINDELHFDYQFKKGICKNMNASFLLKKMNIVE